MLTEHPDNPRIKIVSTLREFFDTPFSPETSAFVYPRQISGRFNEMALCLRHHYARTIFRANRVKNLGRNEAFLFQSEAAVIAEDIRILQENGYQEPSLFFYDTQLDTNANTKEFHTDTIDREKGRVLCNYTPDLLTEWLANEDVLFHWKGKIYRKPFSCIGRFPSGALTRHCSESNPNGALPFIHRAPIYDPKSRKVRLLLTADVFSFNRNK